MNFNRLLSIILISLFTIVSCQKEDYTLPENYESVILRNLIGLDGCSYVLQKVDNKYLEPVNLDEFNVEFEVGKEYWVQYENPAIGGICMVGEVVQLLDIRPPFKHY